MPDFEEGAIYVMGLTTYLVPGRNVCEDIANRYLRLRRIVSVGRAGTEPENHQYKLYRETVRDLMLAGF